MFGEPSEGFGLSELGIKGLRTDPGKTKKNYSDVSMLKYAPSAAHVMGKRFTSSETFTWLTEHFRTSLSQMKPDLDLMFTCGVNHVFFHGSCYTPKNDAWPGWKFYASIDMSPTNTIWRDAPYLMQYIERCQSFLQMGQPDNDFLVYLPVRDMWHKRHGKGEKGLLMQFDIHKMDQKAPEFIKSILTIDSLGYDCDYISDRQLAKVHVANGKLMTEGGTGYKAIIIPSGTTITPELKALLKPLEAYVVYGENDAEMARFAKAEAMKTRYGLRAIRRTNDTGHHYFMANLTPNDVDAWVPLAVEAKQATWFDPMTGRIMPAEVMGGSVKMVLRSGESRILQVSNRPATTVQKQPAIKAAPATIDLTDKPWTLTFVESVPAIDQTFQLNKLQTWENLNEQTKTLRGTGVYTTTVKLSKQQASRNWQIELGDVRESARVFINGQPIGCAWAVPFVLDCQHLLHKGKNEIRIEVTNLPANSIAELDRNEVPWRKMKEINVVDINYKKTTYADWAPMPSGLNSTVRLIAQ